MDVPNPPLNTPPSISSIQDQTLAEDSPMLTVPFTITDLETPANLLTVSAVSSDPSLLSVEPVQTFQNGSSRELRMQPAPDAFGTFTVSVAVSDGGQTTQTQFEVHVYPVNDPPHIDPVPNLVLRNDSGPISLQLTGINCGPTNEQQTISVFAFSNDTNLLPDPKVRLTGSNSSGTLLVNPKPYVTGMVSVQLILVDDGGTESGGVNFATENLNFKFVGPPQVGCVNDTSPPSIVLKGDNPLYLECHTQFVDPGASASDNCAGDLTDFIQVHGSVDTQQVGEYTLEYMVSDGAGTNMVYRAVIVRNTTTPVDEHQLRIQLSPAGDSVQISWIAAPGESLQLETADLPGGTPAGGSLVWQSIEPPPSFLPAGEYEATVPVENGRSRFFRLGPVRSPVPGP